MGNLLRRSSCVKLYSIAQEACFGSLFGQQAGVVESRKQLRLGVEGFLGDGRLLL